ncbi:MAG: hypothetical protein WHT06_10985 [Desulfobacterales bacterium]
MRRKLLFWTAVLWGLVGMHSPDGRLFHGFAALSAALWVAWWLRGRDLPARAAAGEGKPSGNGPRRS